MKQIGLGMDGGKLIEDSKSSFRDIFIRYGAVISLIILIVFNVLFTRNFLSPNILYLIIMQSTSLLFVTVGMTIVLSSGGTDISVGSMMAFCGLIASIGLQSGMNFVLACILAIIATALVGLFNGLLIGKTGVQPIILTLVMQIVIRGLTVLLANSRVYVLTSYPEIRFLGLHKFAGGIPIQSVFFLIIIIVGVILVNNTNFGKYVEAVGGSRKAARLSGINVTKTIIGVYVLSAVFAGFGGIVEMARNGALDPNELGLLFDTDAIAAVAIGGTSMKGGKARISGSIIGCILITLIGITVNMNGVPWSVANIIKGIIIILSLAIQSSKKD